MESDHAIEVTVEGGVGRVVFARPPHNHATVGLLSDIADALEALDLTPTCRAVVLASEGRAFCAGADLTLGSESRGEDWLSRLYGQAERLFATEKPMVAAVQGAAVGAGLGLAVAADFRVVAPEARFWANFVKLGTHPGFGLTHTLPRLIGPQRTALVLLTGRRIDGEAALALGLADELAPCDGLTQAAMGFAAEIAINAPLALVSTRKTLRKGLLEAFRTATRHERSEQERLRRTADYREGVRAVAERRPGNFTAR